MSIDRYNVTYNNVIDFLHAYLKRKALKSVQEERTTLDSENDDDVAIMLAAIVCKLYEEDLAMQEAIESVLGLASGLEG